MCLGSSLKRGMKVGITAPAGPVSEERLLKAADRIRELGYDPVIGSTCYMNKRDYLAGPAESRASELTDMFSNREIRAIFCLRGGYGTLQLLPLLDYSLIGQNPKPFIGYSDITALHIAFQQKTGMKTVHGPMPASDLIIGDSFTAESLQALLSAEDTKIQLQNPPGEEIECLVPGIAKGILIGGNLSVMASTLGTPFEIDTEGKILFLEEVNEEPYRIDRMLTQFALAGKLEKAAGFILGTWTGCGKETVLASLLKECFGSLGKPVAANLRAGHCSPALSLPLGAYASIDTKNGSIVLSSTP